MLHKKLYVQKCKQKKKKFKKVYNQPIKLSYSSSSSDPTTQLRISSRNLWRKKLK